MERNLESTLAALIKVARDNEQLLSAVDRETIFTGARRLEELCGSQCERPRKIRDSELLSGNLKAIVDELHQLADKADRMEKKIAELRWAATTYRDSSDEQWGVLEEAKRLNLDISRLPRFESALFRAEAARVAVRRVQI